MIIDKELILKSTSNIIRLMKSTAHHERIFHEIIILSSTVLKCRSCAFVIINPKTEYLNIVTSHGLSHLFVKDYQSKIATSAIGRLLWTGKPILMKDNSGDPVLADEIKLEYPFGSCVIVQVAIHQKTLGFLFADSENKNYFQEEDVEIFQLLADIAAISYYKFLICEENLRLDNFDHDLEIEKYHSFLSRLNDVVKKSEKLNIPISAIALDVDNFKIITNTYGSEVGTLVLKDIVKIVHEELEGIFHVGRFGFDEIIVMIEDCPLESAIRYSRNIVERIDKHKFTKQNILSTVSIGIANISRNASTAEG
ncbi:MAG: sensor domain-containing diguanylate cyclase [Ignavibacteriales bacterium]|nr:sensor domain-containing diguanylate cyclase [Ignavibacteriales bacterium]